MVLAVIDRCPYFPGEIDSFDDKATLAVPVVIKTVKIDKIIDDDGIKEVAAGITMIAENYRAAKKGRDALKIE